MSELTEGLRKFVSEGNMWPDDRSRVFSAIEKIENLEAENAELNAQLGAGRGVIEAARRVAEVTRVSPNGSVNIGGAFRISDLVKALAAAAEAAPDVVKGETKA